MSGIAIFLLTNVHFRYFLKLYLCCAFIIYKVKMETITGKRSLSFYEPIVWCRSVCHQFDIGYVLGFM
ncbi:hypothetical protein HMPREF2534_03398 [Bacteroides thetaiotaomicron]|nr:hypothetical protein HMPREF2534_03398 [Bacteroides thetaiotaomicron]